MCLLQGLFDWASNIAALDIYMRSARMTVFNIPKYSLVQGATRQLGYRLISQALLNLRLQAHTPSVDSDVISRSRDDWSKKVARGK